MGSSPVDRQALLNDVAARAGAYLRGLDQRKVAPDPAAVAALAALDSPLPQTPSDAAATLDLLDRYGSPATMAMAGPRFFGFVIGGALPGRARRQLAGGLLGPEHVLLRDHAGDRASRADGVALAVRAARSAARLCRRLRHRGDDGQLRCTRRGAPRRTRPRRLKRRGRRPVRRAADPSRGGCGSPSDPAQGARPAGSRSRSAATCPGRWPGPNARGRAADAVGAGDRL